MPALIDWALVRAVWSPHKRASVSRVPPASGACWAFVADKYRFILFGTFPHDQQWRPALVIAILLATLRRERIGKHCARSRLLSLARRHERRSAYLCGAAFSA